MVQNKRDIRGLSQEALIQFFQEHGEQSFRAKQVYQWLWQKSVQSFDQMTNLSKSTRALLDAHFEFNLLNLLILKLKYNDVKTTLQNVENQ